MKYLSLSLHWQSGLLFVLCLHDCVIQAAIRIAIGAAQDLLGPLGPFLLVQVLHHCGEGRAMLRVSALICVFTCCSCGVEDSSHQPCGAVINARRLPRS